MEVIGVFGWCGRSARVQDAHRVLWESTGVDVAHLRDVATVSEPGRDVDRLVGEPDVDL